MNPRRFRTIRCATSAKLQQQQQLCELGALLLFVCSLQIYKFDTKLMSLLINTILTFSFPCWGFTPQSMKIYFLGSVSCYFLILLLLFLSKRVVSFGSQRKHKRWDHPVYLPLTHSTVKAFIKVSWGTFDRRSAFSSFHSCCQDEKGKILAPILSSPLQTDPFGAQLRADREASGFKLRVSRQNSQ